MVVAELGVEQGARGRQLRRRHVVVDHDDLDAEAVRVLDLVDRRRTAVAGHDQPDAAVGQRLDGARVEPVALALAVRDVGQDTAAEVTQGLREHGRRRDAVDIEVAVDADQRVVLDCGTQQADRRLEAGHADAAAQ